MPLNPSQTYQDSFARILPWRTQAPPWQTCYRTPSFILRSVPSTEGLSGNKDATSTVKDTFRNIKLERKR